MAHRHLDKPRVPQEIPAARDTAEAGPSGGFEALLTQVGRNQDRDSFVQLFEHFAPRVKSFLMKGGTPEDAADELAQETMLAVWNKAPSYDPAQSGASTWIFTIARNKKIDSLRKMGRFEVAATDPELLQSEEQTGSAVMRAQETGAIAEALKELPEEQAMLLRQSFFEDKSHADIAKDTGLPLGTVKSRIRLALERLRKNKTVRELWQ